MIKGVLPMEKNSKRDLTAFFNPKSVAIIGASSDPGSFSGKPLHYLLMHGYKGKVYPINPSHDKVQDVTAYKSILDLPETPDHVVLAVNAKIVLPMLEQCVQKGVKYATIFAAGFSEADEEGRALQNRIVELCKSSGMSVCGPNCQGAVNLKTGMTASFNRSLTMPLKPGPISYVSQSGALGYAIYSLAQEVGVGYNLVANTGNEADLHSLAFIEHMLEDPDTKMVNAYLESIKDGRMFARLADRALELGKPIVVIKSGRSKVGMNAAASHTGSIAGSDEVCDAFFRQKGIIRVNDIEPMVDLAIMIERIPALPQGPNYGIITTSGGAGILIADEIETLGLNVPTLSQESQDALMKVLPGYASPVNPVDVTAGIHPDKEGNFKKALRIMINDPDIDALLVALALVPYPDSDIFCKDLVEVAGESDKPIIVSWTASNTLMGNNFDILEKSRIFCHVSPVRTARALGALMKYSVFREEYLSRVEDKSAVNIPDGAKEAVVEILDAAGESLSEHQGKGVLEKYGIRITQESVATSEDDALRIAEEIGYPLALKIDSPDILHKTEAGGLKLDIRDSGQLVSAYREVLANAKNYKPDARINGVLIQEFVTGGTEVIVGMKNDPQFGPTVMFGLGGIFVEVLKDVSMRVAPFSRYEAMDMIKEIKSYEVLAGVRGQARMDVEAVADVLVRVGQLVMDLEGKIMELDINPLVVLPEGRGVRVADALIIQKK